MFDLDNLMDLVDQDQLEFIEEEKPPLNKARLQQGNPDFADIAEVNQTVLYLGGIGLSIEGLREDIIQKGTVVTNTYNGKSAQYVVFRELEVVVLAPSRNRRHYMEIDGEVKLACGSNSIGAHSRGWSGIVCKTCPWHKDNIEEYGYSKEDACKAKSNELIYIPSLDHVAILELGGTSFLPTTEWLDQLSKLSRAYAQRPEVQAKAPGLKRVNPWFFKTTLTTGPFEQGNKGLFQPLVYTKATQPYDWANLLATPEMVQKAKGYWEELKDTWKAMFVDHNPNASMSLPTAEVVAALPAQSSAPVAPDRQIESKVTVETPTAAPAQQVAQQVAQSIQPQQLAPTQPQAAPVVPGVVETQIALDDVDPLPPVNTVMSF